MNADLEKHRERINQIDKELIQLLAQRQNVVELIVQIKSKTQSQMLDSKREALLEESVKQWTKPLKDPAPLISIYAHIIKSFRNYGQSLITKKSKH